MSDICSNVLYLGNTLKRSWQFEGTLNTTIDLTGCTASYGIVDSNGEQIFITNSTDANPVLTIPTPTNGTCMLVVPGSITAEFPVSNSECPYTEGITLTYFDDEVQTYGIEYITILGPIT